MGVSEAESREFQAHLSDPRAQEVRVEVCAAVADEVAGIGHRVGLMQRIYGLSSTVEGLGLSIKIAGDLAQGSFVLLHWRRFYAAAATARQLIETEYLLWAFADDPSEASRWLNGSADDVRKAFRPAVMRRKSGGIFRNSEYWTHCELGGHPTPSARLLLGEVAPRAELPQANHWQWVDLGQHLEALWLRLEFALERHRLAWVVSEEVAGRVSRALNEWHSHDPLSSRHLDAFLPTAS